MAGMMESLQTLNSIVRTVLALVLVGGISAAGWLGYRSFTAADQDLEQTQRTLLEKEAALADSRQQLDTARRRMAEQQQELAASEARIAEQALEITNLNQEVQRLDTALRLHKMERRLARVSVLEVERDEESGETFSTIEFVELNELGDPIGQPRRYRLEGDLVYIDYRVVRFGDEYVEAADLERGTSICLFNRIFGEHQKPRDGFTLDEPGTRPGGYASGSLMSEFEKKIWGDFWTIANDPQLADELGIRAIHGDAVSMKVQEGQSYRVTVRASGGPEFQVEETPAGPVSAPE